MLKEHTRTAGIMGMLGAVIFFLALLMATWFLTSLALYMSRRTAVAPQPVG